MPANNQKVVLMALGGLVLALAVTSGLLYKQVRTLKVDPQKVSAEENKKVLEAVGKLVILPEEAPTIATVTDPDKLKSEQAFFAKSAQGDKVLIYTGALKAIMYRPSENKIVEIAPLIIGNPNASPTPAPTPAPSSDDTDNQ